MIERYTRPIMKELWSDQHRYNRWLEVEILAVEAWESLRKIPQGVANRLKKATVDPKRVEYYEAQYHHDVLAFISAVGETVEPDDAKYIHFGLTSTDVVDTALSSLIVEALRIIRDGLTRLIEAVEEKAKVHRYTPVMGRTHGIHAEPTSFGLKCLLWWLELKRDLERLDHAIQTISVIKISGAVGNYANIPPAIEEYVAERLKLEPAPVSTQVLQRDRHAEVILTLAILGSSLDKIATEIRHMQRTEVRELEEPFAEGQRGSSAMPHKRNPVKSEQISGLARILRGYAVPALEDIPLWHERDISHSSVERVIIPDATTVADYLLDQMTRIMAGLTVKRERMAENIRATGGMVFSGKVLLALVETGMTREDAYKLVQSQAMAAINDPSRTFEDRIASHPGIKERLSDDAIRSLFSVEPYLESVDQIYRRVGL